MNQNQNVESKSSFKANGKREVIHASQSSCKMCPATDETNFKMELRKRKNKIQRMNSDVVIILDSDEESDCDSTRKSSCEIRVEKCNVPIVLPDIANISVASGYSFYLFIYC